MTGKARGGWLISSSGSQAANAVAGMLTNVIYARSLPLDEVGTIALISAIGMFSTVFVDRGIGAWMTRALAANEISFRNTLFVVIRAAAPGLFTLCAVAGLLVFLGPKFPVNAVFIGGYSILFVVCFWIFQVGLSFTQGLNLAGLRSIGIVLNGLLTLGITALVLSLGGKIVGAILATTLAYAAVGLMLILVSATSTDRPIQLYRRAQSGQAIRSSRALFGSNIVTYAVSSGDVLLASLFFSTSQVGQYQIAKKVAQSAVLPLIATLPMVLGKISARDEASKRDFIIRFVRISAAIFSVVLVLSSVVLPFAMPALFGENYQNVVALALTLMTAYQFQFLRDLSVCMPILASFILALLWSI